VIGILLLLTITITITTILMSIMTIMITPPPPPAGIIKAGSWVLTTVNQSKAALRELQKEATAAAATLIVMGEVG
jgi:hypothetical protein